MAEGLGDYLHLQDPSWEWQEHLQHILIFCKTHVERNFAKRFPTHPMRHRILQLWNMPTKSQLLEQMQSICSVYPELSSWLQSKKKNWILSGLTPEESKIPIKWWMYARDHTGISESSHFQDNNFTGRKISILGAVLKYGACLANVQHALTVDRLKLHAQEMFDLSSMFIEHGIDNTWRNHSDTSRLASQMRKKGIFKLSYTEAEAWHSFVTLNVYSYSPLPLVESFLQLVLGGKDKVCYMYCTM